MNREELFSIADKVGLGFIKHASAKDIDKFKQFAALVASAEREACAEICKKHADFYAGLEPSPIAQSAWAACVDNRDTIRARGQA